MTSPSVGPEMVGGSTTLTATTGEIGTGQGKWLTLTVPAEPDYLAALRSLVAAIAAHSGLPMAACDRARAAAHEAARIVMELLKSGSLMCTILENEMHIKVTISGNTNPIIIDTTDVAWVLLNSAADTVTVEELLPVSQICFTIGMGE